MTKPSRKRAVPWRADHNPYCWTMFLAGAGVKQGCRLRGNRRLRLEGGGRQGPCSRACIQTILHLLGLNHEKLTYRYSGRDFRLTDVYGKVVPQVLRNVTATE